MKFKYTILYVDDVVRTLQFYCDAFGQTQSMIHESEDYGELDTGNTILSFSCLSLIRELGKQPVKANANAPTFEIAFETDDVANALQQALSAGATLVQDVELMPWGQTTACVRDINGFLVELCSPIKPTT